MFQTDMQLQANQPDIAVADQEQYRAVVIDVTADKNIRKANEITEKLRKRLEEELEQMWNLNAKLVPVVAGTLPQTQSLAPAQSMGLQS